MELRHYPNRPDFKYEPKRHYAQIGELQEYSKPTGFWVSVQGDQDWPTWCREEDFLVGTLDTEYKIELAEDARILYISSESDMMLFHGNYSVHVEERGYKYTYIDWIKVTQDYQGIIISKYFWKFRYSMNWYYGWDCASGCIWDLKAIKSVTLNTPVDLFK